MISTSKTSLETDAFLAWALEHVESRSYFIFLFTFVWLTSSANFPVSKLPKT